MELDRRATQTVTSSHFVEIQSLMTEQTTTIKIIRTWTINKTWLRSTFSPKNTQDFLSMLSLSKIILFTP